MTPPPGTLLLAGLLVAAAGKATGIKIDLDVAAILVAVAGILTGVVGYRRLRVDRTKIVAEVADLSQQRLERALKASWEANDRLEADVAELRQDLDRAIVVVRGLKGLLEEHGIDVPRELELTP